LAAHHDRESDRESRIEMKIMTGHRTHLS